MKRMTAVGGVKPKTIKVKHAAIFALLAGTMLNTALAQAVQNTTTTFEYDANSNVTKETNGLSKVTTHTYDALSRRTMSKDADSKDTKFEYDGLSQLVKVTDARAVVTSYVIDGLGNLTQTTSGDTGVTNNTYDEAGNLKTRTDAKLQTTTYKYDALNRPVLVTYADSSTVFYVYDQGANAIGRLTKITDSSGSIEYSYDGFGRTVSEARVIGGRAYITAYRFDSAGRLATTVYPSGRVLNYGYDAAGRIAQITTVTNGAVQPLVSAIVYEPFGPVKSLTFGNGQVQNRTHDLDGRVASYSLGSATMAIGYDAASRITSIAEQGNAANGNTYGYDPLDRLTSVITPTLGQSYKYDAVGNRTEKVDNGTSTTLTYAIGSNRLTQTGPQPIAMDANGSITNKGNATFNYDARGRMVSANTEIGLVQYTINSLGQRVRKVTPTETTVFHYDAEGKLIAEITTAGTSTRVQDYVYLGNKPVAVLK